MKHPEILLNIQPPKSPDGGLANAQGWLIEMFSLPQSAKMLVVPYRVMSSELMNDSILKIVI